MIADIRSIPDSLSIAILMIDSRQNIDYLNPSCETLIGSSSKQIRHHKITEVIEHPEGWEALCSGISSDTALVARNTPLILLRLREEIAANIAVSRIRDGGFLIEIEPLDFGNEIVKTTEREHQAEHNRLIIRNLAHEIRNPLSGIKGAAQRLRDVPKAQQKVYLDLITAQVERLNQLLGQMIGEGRPALVMINIHRVLEESIALIKHDARYQNIGFRRDYDPSLPDLEIDPGQMQQVLNNLISNAAKAQDGEGEITIATSTAYPYPGNGKRHKSNLCVTVIDHGSGIPDALQSAIFQPMVGYFQQGSGLGLAIAQRIVHQHGGSIDLKSRPGKTAFSVMLPFSGKRA